MLLITQLQMKFPLCSDSQIEKQFQYDEATAECCEDFCIFNLVAAERADSAFVDAMASS